jgi:nitric oxide reductase NorE protein
MSPARSISARHKSLTHLPGEPGVWVFILGDMLMFALLFGVFVHYRAQDPALYLQSQTTLNQGFGALNTLLLLTSSWFVVGAVQDARNHRADRGCTRIILAFLCGAGFITVKFFEYREKISAGSTLTSNDFYMYYYMLTGIHLLHVVIGMGVLLFLWRTLRQSALHPNTRSPESVVAHLESGASFWHLVDMLWIFLFALLYLMK